MRITQKGIPLKILTVVLAVVVSIGAAIILTWQDQPANAESAPIGEGSGSFIPVSMPALW